MEVSYENTDLSFLGKSESCQAEGKNSVGQSQLLPDASNANCYLFPPQ